MVVGGSSGLGLASARKLAQHGMNICVIYRSSRSGLDEIRQNLLEITELGVQMIEFNLDALNQERILEVCQKLRAEIGENKIRCLLHSLAKGNLKPMIGENSLSTEDFSLTINAMAINLFSWTMSVFDNQLFADDARVLTFTSEGSSKSIPSYAAVSAAKSALESIIRSIAVEFAESGIRANAIQAGVTETSSLKLIPGYEKIMSHSISRNPFNRLTTPGDIANVVYLLCKDEASWINGSIIIADGGENLR